ncbi:TPA: hypothetical protein NJT73_001692 [Acinetobacter baumannii]|uniref:hypothetical protein n=1 Tax=Acinetobacter baumannii TaxID=470 RepID=UPI003905A0D8|nr:hypothetical protein [Acinetobacter baumannii]HCG3421559.1 hypothetical protein [Acinetobacter baumannii]HCG3429164.1 hypothetical protein [Acinetobacter baumannii]HCG3548695.1 hypothetical protein [Acinetobacter baumannii]HCH8066074.1 hypothetical protein [Acinetobacter baumannii]
MITSKTILDMVEYWLNHLVNGKYGSDFGAPLYDLLMAPLDSRVADSFLIKMKKDLPILSELNSDQLALYSQTEGFETVHIHLSIMNVNIDLNQVADRLGKSVTGETYDINAS